MNTGSIEKAKQFIEQNLGQPLNLEDVSRQGGLSKYHFARKFKSATGLTFKNYLNGMRIERAKHLLEHRGMNVTDVFLAVGFNDHSYFNKVFRRFEGKCPSHYQRQFFDQISS